MASTCHRDGGPAASRSVAPAGLVCYRAGRAVRSTLTGGTAAGWPPARHWLRLAARGRRAAAQAQCDSGPRGPGGRVTRGTRRARPGPGRTVRLRETVTRSRWSRPPGPAGHTVEPPVGVSLESHLAVARAAHESGLPGPGPGGAGLQQLSHAGSPGLCGVFEVSKLPVVTPTNARVGGWGSLWYGGFAALRLKVEEGVNVVLKF
eukprot:612314-Hanusia_phi.AAC.1